jgi:competence ComEA-like helix-hairpin-helix protein
MASTGIPVELIKVGKSYPPDVEALADVSLSVPAGEMLFLTGRSGAGKTTLLRLLCRIETPDKGLVEIDGIDLNRADARTLARIPGIGPARAARIAALRQRMGGFTGLEDLLALRGVGKKTLRRLGRWLCVRRETGRGDRTAGPGRG